MYHETRSSNLVRLNFPLRYLYTNRCNVISVGWHLLYIIWNAVLLRSTDDASVDTSRKPNQHNSQDTSSVISETVLLRKDILYLDNLSSISSGAVWETISSLFNRTFYCRWSILVSITNVSSRSSLQSSSSSSLLVFLVTSRGPWTATNVSSFPRRYYASPSISRTALPRLRVSCICIYAAA